MLTITETPDGYTFVFTFSVTVPKAKIPHHLVVPKNAIGKLSRRQNEVLQRIVRSCTNQEIADALNITVRTVKFHASSLFRMFGVSSRGELILMLVHFGATGGTDSHENSFSDLGGRAYPGVTDQRAKAKSKSDSAQHFHHVHASRAANKRCKR